VAQEWRANEISSLMAWIEGASLADFKGVFPLLAEDLQEDNALSLAVRWLLQMCNVLQSLHQKGVIHGDISPKNIIVNGGELVLTDYDFVTKIGNNPIGPGTLIYSSPSFQIGESVYQSDDFYALATSFYHVIFDKEPFVINGIRAKESRLNWDNLDCGEYGDLVDFFNKATHPERDKRFQNAAEVIEHLSKLSSFPSVNSKNLENDNIDADENSIENTIEFSEQKIEWLGYLLQSYPGSKYGNRETRGLDTDFAAQTYVETELEEAILRDVKERKIRLIILCGNAGDGKTALLQHLARKLGLGQKCSSERVIQGKMVDGLRVKMNLDGSAAWNGKSADELLNEFLSPFQKGLPEDDIAHFLAVNDGRLLEWTEQFLEGNKLAIQLSDFLRGIGSQSSSYIRFINMNHRSLVGGITENGKEISFNFLESLIENLYGGVDCDKIWKPCNSCTARESCEVFRAAGVFGPDKISGTFPKEKKKRARRRLFEALQAVHLRGETHITVRELRAALVYILFGVNSCDDYHLKGGRIFSPYWDRAFMANSEGRQGEVLRDLLYFDPALEANPKIDRSLLNRFYPDGGDTFPYYEKLSLSSARRKAYFEWSETEIKQVAGNEKALGLAKGKYLELFKNIALEDEGASNESQEICVRLCGGIAHLENLPPKAIERDSKNFVPLRITPRTPTDTAFWVEKPLKNFYIKPDLPEKNIGLERLHRHVFLIYKYDNGQEERLQIGADLFYLLLELCAGYQLGDVSSEGIFAHLSIFVQRLVREDDNRIFAWNPMEEESIFRLITRIDETPKGFLQRIVLEKVEEGGC
jgi:hypothetical protein